MAKSRSFGDGSPHKSRGMGTKCQQPFIYSCARFSIILQIQFPPEILRRKEMSLLAAPVAQIECASVSLPSVARNLTTRLRVSALDRFSDAPMCFGLVPTLRSIYNTLFNKSYERDYWIILIVFCSFCSLSYSIDSIPRCGWLTVRLGIAKIRKLEHMLI